MRKVVAALRSEDWASDFCEDRLEAERNDSRPLNSSPMPMGPSLTLICFRTLSRPPAVSVESMELAMPMLRALRWSTGIHGSRIYASKFKES